MKRMSAIVALVGMVLCGGVQAAQAEVTFDWVTVGDPGNGCDTQSQGCFGAVAYSYQISKYETTNAQYTEFLNAVAATDANDLYSTSMTSRDDGGITRSGSSGSFSYSVKEGFANKPVNYVGFLDAMRFANWLHNGQPTGAQDNSTTEDGAYTITAEGIANNSIMRNAGASVFLTSEDEWYKAAYYDALSASYFDYPTGTDVPTACVTPGGDTGNSANCSMAVQTVTDVGAYTQSVSPNGTFDQGGNVSEWNEAIIDSLRRRLRGGSFFDSSISLAASIRPDSPDPACMLCGVVGFRVASSASAPSVPSLSPAGLALLATLLTTTGIALCRRRSH
jgi:sulfatase modifying factor 1